MNRLIVYPGAIPLETDVLTPQKNALIAIGYALAATVGNGTFLDGFTCIPTGPASQQVQITAGQILSVQSVDAAAYGSLGTDTHQIIKQGLLLDVATFTCAAPISSGQSINYLIEVGYSDVDGNPLTLPYYNAANPAVAWAGPNNSGTAQNTTRTGQAVVQVKTGASATTGTQVTPTPDVGFTGAFVVTVAFGQTTITSGSIAAYKPTSFIPAKLPTIPAGVQNNAYQYATAGGSSTAYTVATTPASTALVAGATILVNFTTPNTTTTPTLNRDGLGALTIVKSNGTALSAADLTGIQELMYNGTTWQLTGYVASDVLSPVTANVTLYVRTDGNDLNNGSANNSANAFLTIQAAYNYALQRLSFGGFTLTIQLGNTGTYSGPVTCAGGIVCTIKGDAAAQASYIISGVPPSALQGVINCGTGSTGLIGLKIVNSTTTTGFGSIISCGSGSVSMGNVTVASGTNTTGYGISCGNGTISIGTGCIFQCSCANSVLLSEYGGLIGIGANMAVPVALSVGQFALSFGCGTIAWSVPGYVFTGAGVAGTVGQRYSCQLNGTINTGGGGASVFPGNSAGAVSTGGQYQ